MRADGQRNAPRGEDALFVAMEVQVSGSGQLRSARGGEGGHCNVKYPTISKSTAFI